MRELQCHWSPWWTWIPILIFLLQEHLMCIPKSFQDTFHDSCVSFFLMPTSGFVSVFRIRFPFFLITLLSQYLALNVSSLTHLVLFSQNAVSLRFLLFNLLFSWVYTESYKRLTEVSMFASSSSNLLVYFLFSFGIFLSIQCLLSFMNRVFGRERGSLRDVIVKCKLLLQESLSWLLF